MVYLSSVPARAGLTLQTCSLQMAAGSIAASGRGLVRRERCGRALRSAMCGRQPRGGTAGLTWSGLRRLGYDLRRELRSNHAVLGQRVEQQA